MGPGAAPGTDASGSLRRVDALAASLVAVFGTALGAALTHVFQRRNALRAESVAREERLRQERVAAFSSFAGALADYRRGQLDHWYARRREEPGAEQLRREAARLRAVALEAMFRAELLTDSAELAATGRQALKESDRPEPYPRGAGVPPRPLAGGGLRVRRGGARVGAGGLGRVFN
ncbi:conserved hypothetical protein [Streptomyces sp. SPB78]|nr:conserved hypothetical protein [Streptomyces sp. SPB78]